MPYKNFIPKGIRRSLVNWLKASKKEVLINVDELKPHYERAWLTLANQIGINAFGDYLEFGVCHGTSLACMHQVTKELGYHWVRLFGFDSFEGMPEVAQTDDGGVWKPGQYYSPIEKTKKYLTKSGVDWSRVFLTKGWFSNTLTEDLKQQYAITKASVIMIDCDIYTSTKEALEFCAPLIKDKAVICFDDWNSGNLAEKNMGEKKAFDEFLQKYPYFKAEDYGSYACNNLPNGKLFMVTNTNWNSL